MKETFKIPVTWESYGMMEIEADSLEEAVRIAKEDDQQPLPIDSEYVDGSFRVSEEYIENIRNLYN